MKRTYYEVTSPSFTSNGNKVKRTIRKMLVEVIVTNHKAGLCEITPVTGYGTIRVKAHKLQIK